MQAQWDLSPVIREVDAAVEFDYRNRVTDRIKCVTTDEEPSRSSPTFFVQTRAFGGGGLEFFYCRYSLSVSYICTAPVPALYSVLSASIAAGLISTLITQTLN